MAASKASTQLAAFHQPVVSQRPLLLYHCCRTETAVSVLALKSSPCTVWARPQTHISRYRKIRPSLERFEAGHSAELFGKRIDILNNCDGGIGRGRACRPPPSEPRWSAPEPGSGRAPE